MELLYGEIGNEFEMTLRTNRKAMDLLNPKELNQLIEK